MSSIDAKSLLDPFSGIGTTVLTASRLGIKATGIEIMPVGNNTAKAIMSIAKDINKQELEVKFTELLDNLSRNIDGTPFNHIRITQHAFPPETERELAITRKFIDNVKDPKIKSILNFTCMSVLEEISYTRKDGQFLRWDARSGRDVKNGLYKKEIPSLYAALHKRFTEIIQDMPLLKETYGTSPRPKLVTGSSLYLLRKYADRSFDTVITSPPYANRYDYTRTYALELAWLNYGQESFNKLRQELLTGTVENRPKTDTLNSIYGDSKLLATSRKNVTQNAQLGCFRFTLDGFLDDFFLKLPNTSKIKRLRHIY